MAKVFKVRLHAPHSTPPALHTTARYCPCIALSLTASLLKNCGILNDCVLSSNIMLFVLLRNMRANAPVLLNVRSCQMRPYYSTRTAPGGMQ